MSNTGQGPLQGCSTRLLPRLAALACTDIAPISYNPGLPLLLSTNFSARPTSAIWDYGLAISDRQIASTYVIPTPVPSVMGDMAGLGLATRPKNA